MILLEGNDMINKISKPGIEDLILNLKIELLYIYLKREISLIENNNALHMNIETKVLKTLEDDTTSRLIVKRNCSKLT